MILLLFLMHFFNAKAQNKSFEVEGKVTIQTEFKKQTEFYKWYYDSLYYEKARTTKEFECLKIKYQSDSVKVEAWLYKPIKTTNKKWPIIIYNRGGMGNFGNLEETNLVDFHKMAENGYVVIATKTRFSGERGKFDQHGGIDVDDIVNLKNVYEKLEYVDTTNVFMYGFSRGGQNTYQASLRMKLNAMVVTAGTTDWISRANERKEFEEGWTDDNQALNYLGFKKVFLDWETNKEKLLKERSAIYWADKITVPVLILHSRLDTKVPCDDAIKMIQQLQKYNKEYSAILYDEPSHSLPFTHFDSFIQMFKWFEKHKK